MPSIVTLGYNFTRQRALQIYSYLEQANIDAIQPLALRAAQELQMANLQRQGPLGAQQGGPGMPGPGGAGPMGQMGPAGGGPRPIV
jgi:hypothetical protein